VGKEIAQRKGAFFHNAARVLPEERMGRQGKWKHIGKEIRPSGSHLEGHSEKRQRGRSSTTIRRSTGAKKEIHGQTGKIIRTRAQAMGVTLGGKCSKGREETAKEVLPKRVMGSRKQIGIVRLLHTAATRPTAENPPYSYSDPVNANGQRSRTKRDLGLFLSAIIRA